MSGNSTTTSNNIFDPVEYPPTDMTGDLDEHNRPYALYGHLGKK